MTLMCLLRVLDLSRPKAYSPGRFLGRQLWLLAGCMREARPVLKFQMAPLSKSVNRLHLCWNQASTVQR